MVQGVNNMGKVEDFIDKIAPLIQHEAIVRGYRVCSTVIAQAIIESRYGESGLAKYHNYFGLKAGKYWKGGVVNLKTKEEYTVGTLTTIVDGFRTYPTMEDGVKGYYDFISTPRYSGGSPNYAAGDLRRANNYIEYAERLKLDGYATSSTYVKTLCNTVKKYNLEKYDSEVTEQIGTPDAPTLRIGSKGDAVKHVQLYLSLLGYQIGTIDGIYGSQTSNCVKEYQMEHSLMVDGIWGKQCWESTGK